MSFNIKGRDGEYYDIFNGSYFADGSDSKSNSAWKKNNNVITINNKLTTSRGNAKYKATTNSKFKNGNNDIFGTSNLVAKYEIYTESKLFKTVGTFPKTKLEDDSVIVNNMYNSILIVAIGGGGGGERGTSNRTGSPGGTGATVASFYPAPSRLKITIGAGGEGGTGTSGANGSSGGTTKVADNSNNILVQASGGGGGAGGTPTPTNVGANGFQDEDYIVDGNPGLRGAGGAGGGKYNGGFYESGRNGSYGKNGVVYIYYFH